MSSTGPGNTAIDFRFEFFLKDILPCFGYTLKRYQVFLLDVVLCLAPKGIIIACC